MARITVEDSIEHIPNRFELVVLAAQRVRQILAGAEITVERNHDKNTVIALREIAGNTINISQIYEQVAGGRPLEKDSEYLYLQDLLGEGLEAAFEATQNVFAQPMVHAEGDTADEEDELDEPEAEDDDDTVQNGS